MYMPENKRWSATAARKNKAASSKQLISVSGALVLLLLLIAAALIMDESNTPESAQSGMSHDLDQLWQWTDASMTGGAEASDWHLRWRFETEDAAAFDELVAILFRDDEGREIGKTVSNGGRSIQGEVPAYGGATISVHRAEQTEEKTVLMVQLDRKGGTGLMLRELQKSAHTVAEVLAAVSPNVQPGIKTHGYAETSEAGHLLERLSQGKEVDRYEDGGTSSVTLRSALLRLSQPIGQGQTANLQIAVHDNTELGKAEMTVGIPLLTGEFGSVFGQSTEGG